jgi:hypothetical protein
MSTYTIVMKLANNLMILLQSFPYVFPFPSCEFRHLFFQKKKKPWDLVLAEMNLWFTRVSYMRKFWMLI